MGKDHFIVLMILLAVAALPVLVWSVWRALRIRQLRKAAKEMRHGNEIYGEWKRSQFSEPSRTPPPSKRG
jgi:type II secretory pathway pseudopilin PulG